MVVPHHRRQTLLELADQVAEPAISVAVRILIAIFFPEQLEVDAGSL
jgi:hypothetical protein